MLGWVIPPIFAIEVCQTSFLSYLKVTSCVSYLHCIGCCQVLLTKLHCDKNAFCQLSIKSERFFTCFELWVAVTAFYYSTVTLTSQSRWRLNQAIHGTTRSLQTFCFLPYCRWNLMPRTPPCLQKWCLHVKSGSHLSKLRMRQSEKKRKIFPIIQKNMKSM